MRNAFRQGIAAVAVAGAFALGVRADRTDAAEPAPPDVAAVRAVIDSMNTAWEAAFVARNVDGLTSVFDEQAFWLGGYTDDGPGDVTGRRAIRMMYEQAMDYIRPLGADLSTSEVWLADGKAWELGVRNIRFIMAESGESGAIAQGYLVEWVPQAGGGWKTRMVMAFPLAARARRTQSGWYVPNRPGTSQARAAIDSGNTLWARSYRERNADVAMAIYDAEPIGLSRNGRVVRGRDEIRAGFAGMFERLRTIDAHMYTDEVWLAGESAWEYGTYDFVYLSTDTGDTTKHEGGVIVDWRKQPDGGWKTHMTIAFPLAGRQGR